MGKKKKYLNKPEGSKHGITATIGNIVAIIVAILTITVAILTIQTIIGGIIHWGLTIHSKIGSLEGDLSDLANENKLLEDKIIADYRRDLDRFDRKFQSEVEKQNTLIKNRIDSAEGKLGEMFDYRNEGIIEIVENKLDGKEEFLRIRLSDAFTVISKLQDELAAAQEHTDTIKQALLELRQPELVISETVKHKGGLLGEDDKDKYSVPEGMEIFLFDINIDERSEWMGTDLEIKDITDQSLSVKWECSPLAEIKYSIRIWAIPQKTTNLEE